MRKNVDLKHIITIRWFKEQRFATAIQEMELLMNSSEIAKSSSQITSKLMSYELNCCPYYLFHTYSAATTIRTTNKNTKCYAI